MTPREFLKEYSYDERLVNGSYYPSEAVSVESGDTVGVVLLNLGGPRNADETQEFLYNLFMDPAIIDLPVGGILRHWLSKLIANLRANSVSEDYEAIGGGSPINRLTEEQADSLQSTLNAMYGDQLEVDFRTYIAMRYWHPFSEEAAADMEADEVDEVVLLPLYPQYSKTTTGSSLIYWWMLQEKEEIPDWPTSSVFEYATHPKYIQALSERIDEGLQRFSQEVRSEVQLVFSAHGTPLKEMTERRDPYCCLIHSTVDRVVKHREDERPFHVSFQSKVGPDEWLTPSTPDKLEALAAEGHRSVLLIPVAFVTDHIETAYELDIELREEAEEFGIDHYEVTSGLNCHPLFIEALAEVTAAQIRFAGEESASGDGMSPNNMLPVSVDERSCYRPKDRVTQCHQCERVTEAIRWDAEEDEKRVHVASGSS
jgi:ferrochelatase